MSAIKMFPRTCDNSAQYWQGYLLIIPLALFGTLFFAGCEDDPGAPPEPGTVSQMATAVADSPNGPDDADVGFEALGDFEFSTDPLPEAQRIYFSKGNDLWQMPETGAPDQVTEDLSIASYSASAEGDRLAVLTLSRDDEDEITDLSVLRPDGTSLFDLSDLEGTIDISSITSIESVAMNPQGDAVATTHRDGAMALVGVAGEGRQLLQPSIEHRPGRLSWSSDGQFLAYLDPWMPDEPSSLYVHVPARDMRQALVHASSDSHGVIRAEWIPGTPYVVIIKDSGSTISHGGDLFLVDAETGRQELLMSSGSIAPVAGLVDIEPSPDGEWLAATAFVPGDEYPGFAGLWLINLQSGMQEEIELESGEFVTDLWWLGDELVVRTIDDPQTSLPGTYTGREPFRLLEIDPERGETDERYAEDADDA